MSTATSNSIGTKNVSKSGLGDAASILNDIQWQDGGGPGVVLTYSFPSGATSYIKPYSYYGNKGEFGDWDALNGKEIAAVKAALGAWGDVADITFKQVGDSSSVVGDLRFGMTTVGSKYEKAHAYGPYDHPSGGDVWFKKGAWHPSRGKEIEPGSHDYLSAVHEIGHALGLSHPTNSLAAKYDTYSYTVMSYHAHKGGNIVADFYPTTIMWLDMKAMQHMYGAAEKATGNSKYIFENNKQYWETIYDTGGKDLIQYKGDNDVKIDLGIGNWSQLGRQITFGDGSTQKNTVMIGPGTVIENATGGDGDDVLKGNGKKNVLNGGDGKDKLSGGGGNDVLKGGEGKDRLDGGGGIDTYVFKNVPNGTVDTITNFQKGECIKLDNADFDGIGGKGGLDDDIFRQGASAKEADDRIVYLKSEGKIFYDANGDAAGGEVLFARVDPGTKLDHDDFLVI